MIYKKAHVWLTMKMCVYMKICNQLRVFPTPCSDFWTEWLFYPQLSFLILKEGRCSHSSIKVSENYAQLLSPSIPHKSVTMFYWFYSEVCFIFMHFPPSHCYSPSLVSSYFLLSFLKSVLVGFCVFAFLQVWSHRIRELFIVEICCHSPVCGSLLPSLNTWTDSKALEVMRCPPWALQPLPRQHFHCLFPSGCHSSPKLMWLLEWESWLYLVLFCRSEIKARDRNRLDDDL